ncbi:MAG: hypothetical protein EOP73_17180 [Variovorax sp.]|jgi:hypothetical protein|nr:MAG: hypothetical protein EOP73_17180 [Variovorax sp.]
MNSQFMEIEIVNSYYRTSPIFLSRTLVCRLDVEAGIAVAMPGQRHGCHGRPGKERDDTGAMAWRGRSAIDMGSSWRTNCLFVG